MLQVKYCLIQISLKAYATWVATRLFFCVRSFYKYLILTKTSKSTLCKYLKIKKNLENESRVTNVTNPTTTKPVVNAISKYNAAILVIIGSFFSTISCKIHDTTPFLATITWNFSRKQSLVKYHQTFFTQSIPFGKNTILISYFINVKYLQEKRTRIAPTIQDPVHIKQSIWICSSNLEDAFYIAFIILLQYCLSARYRTRNRDNLA